MSAELRQVLTQCTKQRKQRKMKTVFVLYCLLCALWTEGAEINVEGFEGGNISFVSSHKFAETNDKYLCKNQCTDNKDILITVKYGAVAQSERITLMDLRNGSFTVTITRLQLSDSGTYWCAVDRQFYRDTYTEVMLTVKKAIRYETTTTTTIVVSDVSSTWTDIPSTTQTYENTPQQTCEIPTKQSTGAVVYVPVAIGSMFIVLLLAMKFRKCKEISNRHLQVCSNTIDVINADQKKFNCDDNDKRSLKVKSSAKTLCTYQPEQESPSSATTETEHSEVVNIYENIPQISRAIASSRFSVTNVQNDLDVNSRIYINPLPISQRENDDRPKKHANKFRAAGNTTNKPRVSSTSDVTASHLKSYSDSKETKRESLWFGLDLSGRE